MAIEQGCSSGGFPHRMFVDITAVVAVVAAVVVVVVVVVR